MFVNMKRKINPPDSSGGSICFKRFDLYFKFRFSSQFPRAAQCSQPPLQPQQEPDFLRFIIRHTASPITITTSANIA